MMMAKASRQRSANGLSTSFEYHDYEDCIDCIISDNVIDVVSTSLKKQTNKQINISISSCIIRVPVEFGGVKRE